nr:hypothetical protein [Tanacetum cinerariifolium]
MLYQPLGLSQKLEQPLFWVDERVFPTVVDWRTSAPKDGMPAESTYFVEAVRALDTHRTPIQKQPKMLLCLVGISRRYYLGDEVYLTFLHDDDRCREPWPQRCRHPRTCQPPVLPRRQPEEVAATDPSAVTKSRKRGRDGADVNAPPKVLRRDHADPRPTGSTRRGKSLAAIELGMAFTRPVPMPENALADETAAARDLESGNASFAFAVGSPESIYRPEIQARELEIKNLEALLEAEADMKKAAEDNSARLSQELEDMRALFSDFQYEDSRVEQRCAEMDARLDALSIDFDEELYPHMITAIAGRRWMIGRGLRLAVMKCGESLELRQAFADFVSVGIAKGMSEGLRHRVEHGQAQLSLESIEAYDPEVEAKYVAALQALKDLKYPLVDQLEGLKDTPMDVIMAAMYLESDTGDDAPQQVRDLRPSSFQLTIPVYPEVRDPMNPWAYKEEMLLADAIAANISRAEKKKKCRIVCRTHGVGSTHHARSDDVPVSVPTVVPQGLAILLADATA